MQIQTKKTVFGNKPDGAGRLQKEMDTYDLLDRLGIPYGRMDHDEAATIDACLDVEKTLGVEICKNLFLCNAQKTAFYLLMMPGNKIFKTKDLSGQIGSSRLSFAGAEYMEAYLNITPGSVSVLGLMNDKNRNIRLLIDRDVIRSEYIGCHPCVNTASLKIKTSDLLEKFLPYTGHVSVFVQL